MLAKNHRLHQEKDIKRLVKTGKTFFLPQFTIKYLKNKQKDTRIGLVVSARVDKRAVVRNKLSRRLREASRELLPRLSEGYDIIIICKKSALDLKYQEVKKQLEFAFSKIKILS